MNTEPAAGRWTLALASSLFLHTLFFLTPLLRQEPVSVVQRVLTVRLQPLSPPMERSRGEEKAPVPEAPVRPAAKPAKPKETPRPAKQRRAAEKRLRPSPAKPSERRPSPAPAAQAKAAALAAPAAQASLPSSGAPLESAPPSSPAPAAGRGRPHEAGAGSGRVVEISSLEVVKKVRPAYPAAARRRKQQGTVTLLISISGADVKDVKVEKSSGVPVLDAAAAAAVKGWKFRNSGNIKARVPVTFNLTD